VADRGMQFSVLSEEVGLRSFGAPLPLVVVDPVDGSLNAKQGIPFYNVMMALLEGPAVGDATVGCVVNIVSGERWTAIKGQGVKRNGHPITVMPRERADRIQLLGLESSTHSLGTAARLIERSSKVRILGAMALSMAHTAAVALDAFCAPVPMRVFDMTAGLLFFIGDPELAGGETRGGGRLRYHRWGQVLSAFHRGGVYDGEEDKLRDWDRSVPSAVIDGIIAPAIESGRSVVVLAEEWQTAATINLLSDSLYYRGLRDRVVMLWNANNTFGFQRINWGALAFASTITTVSRYMKFQMWEWGQNPIVIPNGVPPSTGPDADSASIAELREAASADHLCFKI